MKVLNKPFEKRKLVFYFCKAKISYLLYFIYFFFSLKIFDFFFLNLSLQKISLTYCKRFLYWKKMKYRYYSGLFLFLFSPKSFLNNKFIKYLRIFIYASFFLYNSLKMVNPPYSYKFQTKQIVFEYLYHCFNRYFYRRIFKPKFHFYRKFTNLVYKQIFKYFNYFDIVYLIDIACLTTIFDQNDKFHHYKRKFTSFLNIEKTKLDKPMEFLRYLIEQKQSKASFLNCFVKKTQIPTTFNFFMNAKQILMFSLNKYKNDYCLIKFFKLFQVLYAFLFRLLRTYFFFFFSVLRKFHNIFVKLYANNYFVLFSSKSLYFGNHLNISDVLFWDFWKNYAGFISVCYQVHFQPYQIREKFYVEDHFFYYLMSFFYKRFSVSVFSYFKLRKIVFKFSVYFFLNNLKLNELAFLDKSLNPFLKFFFSQKDHLLFYYMTKFSSSKFLFKHNFKVNKALIYLFSLRIKAGNCSILLELYPVYGTNVFLIGFYRLLDESNFGNSTSFLEDFEMLEVAEHKKI